jgi:hypothetical protein
MAQVSPGDPPTFHLKVWQPGEHIILVTRDVRDSVTPVSDIWEGQSHVTVPPGKGQSVGKDVTVTRAERYTINGTITYPPGYPTTPVMVIAAYRTTGPDALLLPQAWAYTSGTPVPFVLQVGPGCYRVAVGMISRKTFIVTPDEKDDHRWDVWKGQVYNDQVYSYGPLAKVTGATDVCVGADNPAAHGIDMAIRRATEFKGVRPSSLSASQTRGGKIQLLLYVPNIPNPVGKIRVKFGKVTKVFKIKEKHKGKLKVKIPPKAKKKASGKEIRVRARYLGQPHIAKANAVPINAWVRK